MRRMHHVHDDHILVRPFVVSDTAAVAAIFGMDTARAAAWLAYNIANEQTLARLDQPPYGERAVVRRLDDVVVGAIGLVPCVDVYGQVGIGANDGYTHAEVGMFWSVLPQYRRLGYATAAARLLRDYACSSLGLRRVIATTEYDNAASQAVMRHIGMELRTNPQQTPSWLQVVGVYEPQRQLRTLRDGMYLRPIVLADLATLIALWRTAGLALSPSDTEVGIRRHLGVSGNLAMVVCTSDDTIIASVLASDDGRRGWLNHLAVHPAYQGRGLGRVLVDETITRLRAQGCEKLNLLVRNENAQVCAFYEALGFGYDGVTYMTKWITR
ncbi:MAG: GNAT family N-acetyltransferase [Roseiflexaceae bacterium]